MNGDQIRIDGTTKPARSRPPSRGGRSVTRCETKTAGRGLLSPDRQCEDEAVVLLTAPEINDRARRRLTPNGQASLDQHGYVGLCRDHRDQLRDA